VLAVLTAEEMAAADAAAIATIGLETLIARAGRAVAVRALEMTGGGYGRRIVVVAGKGHNGDDGRVAAAYLERRGATVSVVAPGPGELPGCDLVIDAAFGTGFHGAYDAPSAGPSVPVLAVDIPSGVHCDTGEASPGAVRATATVSFAALKPGLLLGAGPEHAGEVRVVDIGLGFADPGQHLVEDADLAWLAPRPRDTHKWASALYIVAGSPGMSGAAELSALGALRSGAGMVRLGSPGADPDRVAVAEAVARDLPETGWAESVLGELGRCRALVVGPGLGTSPSSRAGVLELLARAELPVVLDADGLNVLGRIGDLGAELSGRRSPLVLTPHDGEFARLAGSPPGADRVGAARALATAANAVVLLKGPTTVVAAPTGEVLLAAAGTPALATAGTGDVLSGVIGALLARGLAPLEAAGLAAHVHGLAARRGLSVGLVSGDLPRLVAEVLSDGGGR